MSSKKCTIAMLICIGTASIFSTCKKGGILGCHESFAYTIDAPSLAGVPTRHCSINIILVKYAGHL